MIKVKVSTDRIKVLVLQTKLLGCFPAKEAFYTLVFTQHHDCRSHLWEQQAQTIVFYSVFHTKIQTAKYRH